MNPQDLIDSTRDNLRQIQSGHFNTDFPKNQSRTPPFYMLGGH